MKTLTSFAVSSARILTRTESATPLTSSPRCIATDSLGLPSKLRLSKEPEANFSYVPCSHRPQRPPGCPSLLATSGVMSGRPSANRSRKGWVTKSGAPRM